MTAIIPIKNTSYYKWEIKFQSWVPVHEFWWRIFKILQSIDNRFYSMWRSKWSLNIANVTEDVYINDFREIIKRTVKLNWSRIKEPDLPKYTELFKKFDENTGLFVVQEKGLWNINEEDYKQKITKNYHSIKFITWEWVYWPLVDLKYDEWNIVVSVATYFEKDPIAKKLLYIKSELEKNLHHS